MPKKFKLMIVDDEQDNLDLLYRTFRREFKVYKASNPALSTWTLVRMMSRGLLIDAPWRDGDVFYRLSKAFVSF